MPGIIGELWSSVPGVWAAQGGRESFDPQETARDLSCLPLVADEGMCGRVWSAEAEPSCRRGHRREVQLTEQLLGAQAPHS